MDMKGLYAKDIFRSIDGVVKADDVSKVASEVDEYVMTKEIRDGLADIVGAWNQVDAPSNGVWISGFFGSGKSHLLKMLSYLLGEQAGSQPVTREDVERAFEQKVAGNEATIADLKRSLHTPTRACSAETPSALSAHSSPSASTSRDPPCAGAPRSHRYPTLSTEPHRRPGAATQPRERTQRTRRTPSREPAT